MAGLSLPPQESTAASGDDLRCEDDRDWLANASLVRLHGLSRATHLNGQVGEVVGFDDSVRRYRVLITSDNSVKVVAKKNLLRLTQDLTDSVLEPLTDVPVFRGDDVDIAPCVPSASSTSPARPAPARTGFVSDDERSFLVAAQPEVGVDGSGIGPGPLPTADAGEFGTMLASLVPSVELAPTRDSVLRAIDTVQRNSTDLESRCDARRLSVADGGQVPEEDLSDFYLRLHASMDTLLEVLEMYKSACQVDQELSDLCHNATERFASCTDSYQVTRTWREYAQDEWNMTKHNIQRHGVLGTLQNDLADVKNDVVDVACSAPGLARASTEAVRRVPVLVRSATATVGEAVRGHSSTASRAVGHVIEEQVTAPVRRMWSIFLLSFLMCFIIPLFALRAYAPINSVVANLGLVYSAVVVVCPPRWARSRRCRGMLVLLWPLFFVVLPIALHYWLLHPPANRPPGAILASSPSLQPPQGRAQDDEPLIREVAGGTGSIVAPPRPQSTSARRGRRHSSSDILLAVRDWIRGRRHRVIGPRPEAFLASPQGTRRNHLVLVGSAATASHRASVTVASRKLRRSEV
eukprot:TRINITY_DN15509_c0_g1_i2.p1 TRINITY_DN15509_c0_g1~~TRINITY_DN15509_c0_g1_i2.p1  ORF type:complete len:601 (+),score=65.83 TRINITY_DN15509_c0_g1_i2:71-1804(+)